MSQMWGILEFSLSTIHSIWNIISQKTFCFALKKVGYITVLYLLLPFQLVICMLTLYKYLLPHYSVHSVLANTFMIWEFATRCSIWWLLYLHQEVILFLNHLVNNTSTLATECENISHCYSYLLLPLLLQQCLALLFTWCPFFFIEQFSLYLSEIFEKYLKIIIRDQPFYPIGHIFSMQIFKFSQWILT